METLQFEVIIFEKETDVFTKFFENCKKHGIIPFSYGSGNFGIHNNLTNAQYVFINKPLDSVIIRHFNTINRHKQSYNRLPKFGNFMFDLEYIFKDSDLNEALHVQINTKTGEVKHSFIHRKFSGVEKYEDTVNCNCNFSDFDENGLLTRKAMAEIEGYYAAMLKRNEEKKRIYMEQKAFDQLHYDFVSKLIGIELK